MRLRHRARGFTLLESMIAIVVVALGILGVLGVQLRTLSDTQTAVRRAQAIRLIEDLAERVRANPSALAPTVLGNYAQGWGTSTAAIPDCTAGCTAPNLARADVLRWKQTVRSTMPLGDAAVFVVADAGTGNVRPQLGVMVSWRENEREAATTDEATAYRAPWAVAPAATGSSTAAVACPAERICHLQYVLPTLRCTPWSAADASNQLTICP